MLSIPYPSCSIKQNNCQDSRVDPFAFPEPLPGSQFFGFFWKPQLVPRISPLQKHHEFRPEHNGQHFFREQIPMGAAGNPAFAISGQSPGRKPGSEDENGRSAAGPKYAARQ